MYNSILNNSLKSFLSLFCICSLKGNITDLIANDKTRKSAMSLVELLLRAAPLQTSAGDTSPSDLAGAQDQVIQLMEMAQTLDKREILLKTQILNIISHAFETTPSMRNSFRSFGGYVTLISVLVSLEEIYTELTSADGITTSEGVAIQEKEVDGLVEAVLDLLRKSMTGSSINGRHFIKNVTYGSLENAIKMTGVLQNLQSTSKLFGTLLAFATDRDEFKNIFVPSNQLDENQPSTTNDVMTVSIETRLNSSSVRLVNADVMISIMNLQKEIGANHELSTQIFTSVLTLACGSRHNQILLNRNGMILHLLERLYPKPTMFELSDVFEEHALTDAERHILTRLLQRLTALGMSYAELRYLFEAFEDQQSKTISLTKKSSAIFLDTLRHSVESSRWPNFIHLDLAAKQTSTITLDHVLPFPPSSGYTLLFWIHIEKQTESSRLTILDVIQNGETKLSIAVDGQTRHLHIEVQGRKQIMSFDAFQFQPNYWYHIGLVHNRSRLGLTSSIMALYVNGSFLEQIRCPYNLSSGSPQSKLIFGGLAPENLHVENRQVVWDLGPSYIIEDTLDSDIVNLLFNVGARYTALFQDSLKQFQSYETSTTLFLKLRSLSKASSKGDSSHSAFVEAMRGIGSTVIPEQKIVVALFAGNTLFEDAESMIYPCNEGIKRFLASRNNFGNVTLNSAVPKINKALWQPNGLAYLLGSPLVVRPASVDDVLWKVGGFSAVLKLVEVAEVCYLKQNCMVSKQC
jgi:beige protein homolog 1